ncbi:hypothetical protein IAG25_25450 [Caballeronia sp. EK]|uniref:hypothetical protein n=1 Tax=Caballeronia sp. EK TaxID=2767469 RepID=UPI001654E445|nr:hypothetical protein [Caballeronia sp. EK]MBC8640181.1 hypothetical protein [Caballeronia sp. EK]
MDTVGVKVSKYRYDPSRTKVHVYRDSPEVIARRDASRAERKRKREEYAAQQAQSKTNVERHAEWRAARDAEKALEKAERRARIEALREALQVAWEAKQAAKEAARAREAARKAAREAERWPIDPVIMTVGGESFEFQSPQQAFRHFDLGVALYNACKWQMKNGGRITLEFMGETYRLERRGK